MTLHEAMHAFVSYWLGDDTAKSHGRLTFNPLKHIDPFMTILLPVMLAIAGLPVFGGAKPVPFDPRRVRFNEWGSALMAMAGPLTNLIIAFIASGVWVAVGTPLATEMWGQVLLTTITVNLGFFVFNILPLPPLDGSRILYALAPEFVRRGMEKIERHGILLIFIIILIASPYIGVFMSKSIQFFFNLFLQIF
jgi:Zn-dependent protease